MSPKQINQTPSLDSINDALSNWRENKANYPDKGIPDEIWLQIFQLEDNSSFSDVKLRSFFSLNSQQYRNKHAKLIKKDGSLEMISKPIKEESGPAPIFSEVCVVNSNLPPLRPEPAASKATIKSVKTTNSDHLDYIDTSCVIVECFRRDGERLKIHTTTKRLDEVMRAFYNSQETD